MTSRPTRRSRRAWSSDQSPHPICVFFALFLLASLCSSCYEDRVGCLNPDAGNYDLEADSECADCCTFPELSVQVTSVWQDSAVVIGRTYTDGGGNPFQFVRFRYYLGSLRLEGVGEDLPDPFRPVQLQQNVSGDTAVTVNGNYLLADLSVNTTLVGTLSQYGQGLSSLSGTYGLDDRYRNLIPASAPTGDALRSQAGLLNFNDGRGYVQAKLEYTRGVGTDTLVRTVYGSRPFTLSFGQDVAPRTGFDVRVDVEARLSTLFSQIDLSADSTTVANALGQSTDFLGITGLEL